MITPWKKRTGNEFEEHCSEEQRSDENYHQIGWNTSGGEAVLTVQRYSAAAGKGGNRSENGGNKHAQTAQKPFLFTDKFTAAVHGGKTGVERRKYPVDSV